MTRRIVIAILVACWTVFAAGGVLAYWATRSVLLADLDAQLLARAMSVPEVVGTSGSAQSQQPGDRYVVKNDLGQTVGRLPSDDAVTNVTVVDRRFGTVSGAGRVRTLVLRATAADTGQPVTVVYSGSAASFDLVVARLALALTGTALVAGLASAGAAVIAAHGALRPLRTVAETIGQIDEARLNRRIDEAALPPELSSVARRLNEMLARLERTFEDRRRFLAAAAHELRTPVAGLMTTLEVALRRPRDVPAMTAVLRRCLDDAGRLRAVVTGLMRQVRGEAEPADQAHAPQDVIPLLRRSVELASQLGQTRQVAVTAPALPGSLRLSVSPDRLAGVIGNLLTNAVEHGNEGGHVELAVRIESDGRLLISVVDDGPGIPEGTLPHIFEPFVRGQNGRSAAGDDQHLGLGLSLVRTHVTAMGGKCELISHVGTGTTARVWLPAPIVERCDPPSRTEAGAAAETSASHSSFTSG